MSEKDLNAVAFSRLDDAQMDALGRCAGASAAGVAPALPGG
jgi:hypothetical protein